MKDGRMAALAVVAEVVRLGEQHIDRVGHTLIQKLVYLLQEGMGVRLGYRFKMYMHGPYSADLWGDLTQLRDYRALNIDADPSGYGYRITTGPVLGNIVANQERTLAEVRPTIERLLKVLGGSPVRRLEVLATAHFASANLKQFGKPTDAAAVAKSVCALKPHLTAEEVAEGYRELTREGLVS